MHSTEFFEGLRTVNVQVWGFFVDLLLTVFLAFPCFSMTSPAFLAFPCFSLPHCLSVVAPAFLVLLLFCASLAFSLLFIASL